MKFQLTTADLKRALDELAERDRHIAAGLARVGYPEQRRHGAPSYEHLMRIIAGQQLSVKAAASIFGRVEQALGGDFRPERLLEKSDDELRATGLSRQKIGYARALSEAVRDGALEPQTLWKLSDEAVIETITSIKGFGRWSAEMFLLFSLGRPDVWPADDLGIQAGLHRLKNMRTRPDQKKADAIAKPWRPYRGAAAIFVWHYYSNAPI
ncbi:MAG: DNA-3-methyladenine glycosylase 2 family protein [Wenzhouxiangellaceae bacterium]|nr:DNA-3-methyladenine glycosylase 2 family protein [Wenzhouxiangellaceae bacterium]